MSKLLIASDSFKGTFTSVEIGKKFKELLPEHQVDMISISDGGEGFTQSVRYNTQGASNLTIKVNDAMHSPINVEVLIHGQTAYFDTALVVALNDYPGISAIEKSSSGIGQVISKLEELPNIDTIAIGLGGTSTSLIGWGMLMELGVKFLDANGKQVLLWEDHKDIVSFEGVNLKKEIVVYSDVTTNLNEVTIYTRQKFVTEEQDKIIIDLVSTLKKFDDEEIFNKPGTGAAGGLGYAFQRFLGANYKNGLDKILEISVFKELSSEYDYVVTGEGKFDDQSAEGKVPLMVKENSKAKKNILIAGVIEAKEVALNNFDAIYELKKESQTIEESIKDSKQNLEDVINFIKVDLKNSL